MTPFRQPSLIVLASLAILLLARGAVAAPVVRNTTVAQGATWMQDHIHGRYFVYGTPETTTDLNGDGDTNDVVATRFDAKFATTLNLGLAMDDFVYLRGKHALIEVREAGQGADLNGDGDTNDHVIHQVNLKTGVARNLGLAGTHAIVGQNMVLVNVQEAAQGGQDQNGDGDIYDLILWVYDLKTGTAHNTGACGPASTQRQFLTRVWNRSVVAWLVSEVFSGADLNGDGDTLDHVLHTYAFASQTTTNHGLACTLSEPFGVQGHNEPGGPFDGPEVVFSVSESAQGQAGRNGDGDTTDEVVAVLDTSTGSITNLGLAHAGFRQTRSGRSLIRVPEAGHGAGDLNGDGDVGDSGVLHVHDVAAGTTSNLGYDALFMDFSHGVALVVAGESANGIDGNGDGDTYDSVPHAIDLATMADVVVPYGVTTSAHGSCRLDRGWIALRVLEGASGAADLNGDGDTSDVILVTLKTNGTGLKNTGVDVGSIRGVTSFRVLLTRDEATAGDLNGDGDAADRVVHFADARTGSVTNLALAESPTGGTIYDVAAQADYLWFLVDEGAQGADLNADGDTNDRVVHSAR